MTQPDTSAHYLFWHNTEAVTLTVQRSAGATAVAGVTALRRALSRGEHAAGGAHLHEENVAWNLPHALLAGQEPQPGDTLTDSVGVVWMIAAVQRLTWGTRWRCLCRPQR